MRIFATKDAETIFGKFLERNEDWCSRQRQKHIENLARQLSEAEPPAPRQKAAPPVQGDRAKKAELRRARLLREELERCPFRPVTRRERGNKVRYHSQADRLFE